MSDSTSGLTVEQPVVGETLSGGDRRKRARLRVPAITILFHPDVRRTGERAILRPLLDGRTASLSRLEPEFESPDSPLPRPLLDRHLSRSPLRLTRGAKGAIDLAIGETRTRVVADGVPVTGSCSFAAPEIERGVILELANRVVLLLHTLPGAPPRPPEHFGMIGESEGIVRVRHDVRRVAGLEVPVLLRGETGTGKELVARAIHEASGRSDHPFLSLNMGAIPSSLAAAELFGSVKGSFTGSVKDQLGYFQRAHGGTLFLDEIGEAPPEVQVMLLRVLETGEIQRIGGSASQSVDVRLIAATDADLEEAIERGRFRAPLLHRLAGYEIVLPPLRERIDDFGRLFLHFLEEELRGVGEEHRLAAPPDGPLWLPPSVLARLARHDWPGNVRQLRNAVRQIVIASRDQESAEIGPQIERLLRDAAPPGTPLPEDLVPPPPPRRPAAEYRSPAEIQEPELLAALRAARWEVKLAAERLGISRPSLYLLIDKFPTIRKAVDLTREEILDAREACGGKLDAMVDCLEVSKKGLQQRMTQLGIE
jgi:DNA-binding NtrC family response regulator